MTDERRPDGFHYGPTDTDPDHGKMWHHGCGQEVYAGDNIYTCGCGAQWVENEHGVVLYLRDPRRKVTCRWNQTYWLVTLVARLERAVEHRAKVDRKLIANYRAAEEALDAAKRRHAESAELAQARARVEAWTEVVIWMALPYLPEDGLIEALFDGVS